MQQRVPTAEEMSLFWELMGQVGQNVSEESTFLQMNFDEFLEAVGQIFEVMAFFMCSVVPKYGSYFCFCLQNLFEIAVNIKCKH